jgi:hypothetical protein
MEHLMATNAPIRTVDTFEIRQQQQIRAPREIDQAMGMIPAEHRQDMQQGWEDGLKKIGAKAEHRAG